MHSPKLVLVADDSQTVRKVLVTSLSGQGFSTLEAVDGCDAMRQLEQNDVNLIITDLDMPHMGGLDLIRHVRKHPRMRFTPIIILTGRQKSENCEKGKRAGASGWLVKPFSPKQLTAIVNLVVGC